MTEIYLHFRCTHYGLYGNAPVRSHALNVPSHPRTHRPVSVGWRTGRPTRRGIEAMADGSQPLTKLAVRRPHRPRRQKRARRGCT